MLLPLAVTVLAHSRDRKAQMYGLHRVSSAETSATPLAKQKRSTKHGVNRAITLSL